MPRAAPSTILLPNGRKGSVVRALVVYESVYGNTRVVAEAIAQGAGDGARVRPVSTVGPEDLEGCELLVVGGPTHMHGMTTRRSRELAAEAARERGPVEPDAHADSEPGLRTWLHTLADGHGMRVAAFDTRLDSSPLVTGQASHGIARRLRRHGYELLASESFLVSESEGPLVTGELDRARRWGAELAARAAARPGSASLTSVS